MINVSNKFREQIEKGAKYLAYADITLSDGTILNLKPENLMPENSIEDCANSNSFPIGNAISKSITLLISNHDDEFSQYDFFDASIVLYGAQMIPINDLITPYYFDKSTYTLEKVKKGTYTVIIPETPGDTIEITALDDMYKTDVEYDTKLMFPATTGAILRDACSQCGINLGSATFKNDNIIINEKPLETSFREVIAGVALLACGNARIDASNFLQIVNYDFSIMDVEIRDDSGERILDALGDTVLDENSGAIPTIIDFKESPKLSTYDVVITGIQCKSDNETFLEGTEGYVIEIENILVRGMEAAAANIVGTEFIGRTFRLFEGDIHGDITCEFGDSVCFHDYKGNTYKALLTDVSFQFTGYTTIKCKSDNPLRNLSKYDTSSTKGYVEARRLIKKEQSDRELAIETLRKALTESSGLFSTEEVQPDNSVIYYAHNKPTMDESDIIWKFTAEAIGISTDGGKTYPYGFQVTGDMITKVLHSVGVNADWINTGSLVVKGKDGEIMALFDFDTHRVEIHADIFTVSGKTVTDIVSEESVNAFDNVTQQQVFNKLTNNGALQGLYMSGNQLYINFNYARGGTLVLGGNGNGNGVLDIRNSDGKSIITGNNEGLLIHYLSEFWGSETYVDMRPGSWAGVRVAQYLETSGYATIFSKLGMAVGKSLDPHIGTSVTGLTSDVCDITYNGIRVNGANWLNNYSKITSDGLSTSGTITCSGTKSRVADTKNYEKRKLYCYETTAPYFGDIGEGNTDENGICYVFIDDIFAETVSTAIEYQVFLQKEGAGDLWVERKETNYFIVNGTSNLKFAWEVKIRQNGYEHEWLEVFNDEEDEEEMDYEAEANEIINDYYKELEEICNEEID